MMFGPNAVIVLMVASALVAWVFGWAAGRASGKVHAIEAVHDINLSESGGDEDAE